MITRRAMVAGGALALAGSSPFLRAASAAEKPPLPSGLAGGRLRLYRDARGLARQEAADQLPSSSAQLRDATLAVRLGIHAERKLLRALTISPQFRKRSTRRDGSSKWAAKVSVKPLELRLSELRSSFDPVEIAAVCQCSGNRRGFSGAACRGRAMGTWRKWAMRLWRGARLKDVLGRANVRPETRWRSSLNGADGPVVDGTPDFVKSIPVDKALDDNTLIAYEMNGAPLPHYNGFPIRLVVPGWDRNLLDEASRYHRGLDQTLRRLLDEAPTAFPTACFPIVQHFVSQMTAVNEPITEMVINSMITAPPSSGHTMRAAETAEILAASLGTAATA